MLKRSASLTIVLAPLALAHGAAAQAVAAPAVYGGGVIAPSLTVSGSTPKAYDASVAVGLRRDGGKVAVRVAFSRSCAKYRDGGWRASDAVTTAPLAADGTFHLAAKKVRTEEMGTVRLTLDGVLGADRADGTLHVDTAFPCDGRTVTWTARPVAPGAALPAAAPAPVAGLLYGATSQDLTGAPHGLVVRVVDGATGAYAFGSYTGRCDGRDGDGAYHNTVDYQTLFDRTPIAAGRWARRETDHQSTAERRQGTRWTRRSSWNATFAGAALSGTLREDSTYDYRAPARDKGRCTTGTIRFTAAP